MLTIIILILLTVSLYTLLNKLLDRDFLNTQVDYERRNSEYAGLVAESRKINEENSVLEKNLEATIALYDITKEICKSLDEDKVIANFCELINKYIKVGTCKLIKEEADLSRYDKHTVLPLNIDKDVKNYLITNKLNAQDTERLQILAGQFLLGIKRAVLYEKIQEMTITDSLTGVFSRRHLLERLNEELERSRKFNYNFSFLMLDIDYFKDYNDRYGHLVGDAILKEVSRTIKDNIRQIDLVGRYGGEEFSVILSETDRYGAGFAAERIRQAIEEKSIKVYDEDLKVTLSIGVSVFPEDAKDTQALMDKADMALYRAKEAGRNRVYVLGVK